MERAELEARAAEAHESLRGAKEALVPAIVPVLVLGAGYVVTRRRLRKLLQALAEPPELAVVGTSTELLEEPAGALEPDANGGPTGMVAGRDEAELGE